MLFCFGFCFVWPKCSLRTGQGSPVKGKKNLISIDCVVQDPLLMCHGSTHDSYSPVELGWGEVRRWNHGTSLTPDANSWKHWHTKTYRNKKENVQASMGFILLSPSSIATNFLRSYEVVGACQAEWPPPLVASYFTATSALLFPFTYHVMARFHYKYISWNRKLKQPLLLGVFWESCCIFCGLRSSRKRNPIKRHRGSHMIQSIADV